jgi:pimeloyl-ACP methyl ester carboxylesterase
MATFVLVHPAWFGGWCWKKVATILRARGNEVFAPTLTGLGERAHLANREVGLGTHIDDVASVLKFEDIRDAILVGNSSGGMVITGVADRMPERIAHVVYLDAFVPEDGQSLFDIVPSERSQPMHELVQKEGDGWLAPRFAPPNGKSSYPKLGTLPISLTCAGCCLA